MTIFGYEHEEQSDPNDCICPYCGYKYQVEAEDYDEDERAETCDECGKKYWLHQEFSVDHETRPDCELNGDEHQWRHGRNNNTAEFCVLCGKCRLVS